MPTPQPMCRPVGARRSPRHEKPELVPSRDGQGGDDMPPFDLYTYCLAQLDRPVVRERRR